MRWRPWLWLCVSVLCFIAAAYFWQLGDKWAASKGAAPSVPDTNAKPVEPAVRPSAQSSMAPVRLLSEPGNLNVPPSLASIRTNQRAAEVSYRLSNNHSRTPEQHARSEQSILLENALIDTSVGVSLPIPEWLKAQGDPGSYIVQAKGPIDAGFRAALKNAGAVIVSYIPNNAYLVRASEAVARQLQAGALTQAVLPYEPYYKLSPGLLQVAMEQGTLPKGAYLNLLLFADASAAVEADLAQSGTHVVGRERSPFGPVVKVLPGTDALAALARLPGVQAIELVHARRLANDLSRVALGLAADSTSLTNYLGLSGSNIVVNVNDTGVDTNHPDLKDRVVYDLPISGVDSNGHGTHVAGIIAGDGSRSTTVSNAQGSVMPPVDGQFRGKAPGAKLYSLEFSASDSYLQEKAARTNALISNNSWTYDAVGYNLASASYDAAVRDSLPTVTGPQGLAYVFATGNGGVVNVLGTGANEGGTGGAADTIRSPGTAKNVITVGAVEQFRNITNETSQSFSGFWVTNTPWTRSSDSSNQVAGFSGRGNVGINLEGDFGRFKPDVVAPGTFVVSTRSGQWNEQDYYSSLEYSYDLFTDIVVETNSSFVSSVFVPANAVQLTVRLVASDAGGPLPVLVISPSAVTVTGPNQVSIPPMGALQPVEDFWVFAVSNNTPKPVAVAVQTVLALTNNNGDFFQVLSNLNNELGPYYRYESGSSMAAAEVSGTLALMHEFFQQRLKLTNSPALMKALLINGARSLGNAYNFQVESKINYQGWGQVQLPNSIPEALTNLAASPTGPGPMYFFDQSVTNALVTGQRQTRFFSISPTALGQDLRVTAVWTDPPGNPTAAIKLVNDLDVVVTNLDTGDVYFGNDIRADKDYTLPWDTNELARLDIINNVENVYIRQAGFTNFSVTVVGHRVNVNAVSGHPDNVAQDYALVVSSGNGLVADALQMRTPVAESFVTLPNVTFVTNTFPSDPANPVSGGLLMHQHVGANTPLLGTNTLPLANTAGGVMSSGMTNQWRFYVLSNDFNFTNASFVTFLPPNLAVPRGGVNVTSVDNATRPEADIDMYVSTSPGLTNLDPAVLVAADKSIGRGGTEFLVYSNAAPGAVYYVGIKSEDQMASEFEFLGVFSLLPPTSGDEEGNLYLRGLPVPSVIPPGTPRDPQAAVVLGLNVRPITVRRVIVTNMWNHTMPGSLLGNLSHGSKFTVLNNHTCATDPQGNCYTNIHPYIYEDNGEGNVTGSRPSDGPGSLKDFIGEEGIGVWLLTMVNNFPAGTGAVNNLLIKLEPQSLDTNGIVHEVLPNTFVYDSIDVPADATNLTVCVSGNTAPMDLYVRRDALPTTAAFDYHLSILPPGDCLAITTFDTPPLVAGRYYIGVFNSSATVQRVRITATIFKNPYAIASSLSSVASAVPIADDAVTYAYITNLVHMTISALDVGLLIHHPRISDLALTLVSPSGTRVLLFEDRGAVSTNGLGTFSAVANDVGGLGFGVTNMAAFWTNDFEDAGAGLYAPGSRFGDWSVLANYAQIYPQLPAPWLSNNVLVLGDGVVATTLPTTNSTAYSLSFNVTHAPYLTGTVAWWPLDEDGRDIFGGFDGLLSGNVRFNVNTGMVNEAFFGDGVGTRMVVPAAPALEVGAGRGFTVEGWIRPANIPTNALAAVPGIIVWSNSFEGGPYSTLQSPTNFGGGWSLISGQVDMMSTGVFGSSAHSGKDYLDLNGWTSGTISTNVTLVPGKSYFLSFALTRNPDSVSAGVFPVARVSIGGTPLLTVAPSVRNSWTNLNWQTTSVVFTASAALSPLEFSSLSPGASGVMIDSVAISEKVDSIVAAPIVEWSGLRSALRAGTNVPTPVVLQQPTATFSQTASGDFSVARAVDGITNDNFGWGIQFGITNQTAVFETATDIGYPAGTVLTFRLLQYGLWYSQPHTIGRFRLSATSDDRGTFADGLSRGGDVTANWTVLEPNSYISSGGATLTRLVDNSILASGVSPETDVYTVTAITPLTRITGIRLEMLTDPSLPFGGPGRAPDNGNFVLSELQVSAAPAEVEQGVQFWLSGLPGTNVPGALYANLWDTNGQPHIVGTVTNAITNSAWQHVALSYDAASRVARLYANGRLAVAQPVSLTNFMPRTSGDVYLGYHPGSTVEAVALQGGLDEMGLYSRALWDSEIMAIWDAGKGGKYGTNVLRSPVTNSVQLITSLGATTYTFTNGFSWWTNGPRWETNTIFFTNLLQAAYTNGPVTNFTRLILSNGDENGAFDNFVLSGLRTNLIDGQMHFTENTNLARLPIKFAQWPYVTSNFPPTLVFSNDFELATQGVYVAGSRLPGSTNNPALGPRDWRVVGGPVTVLSNVWVDAEGTNAVALGRGGIQCTLPTSPGHRYEVSYSVRGPGAVSWWSGDVEPLSQRAWDLLGGNQGAFIHQATNTTAGWVNALGNRHALLLPGVIDPTNGYASKIELGDPVNLRLTNAFTIEGWVRPMVVTNLGVEQILFRGDSRSCSDPYYLALRRVTPDTLDILFHIENEDAADCGIVLATVHQPVVADRWQHIAAVFEPNVTLTNRQAGPTNQLRLYYNGTWLRPEDHDVALLDSRSATVWNDLTGRFPFRDLDEHFSPGVAIGNRSRLDNSQPFTGYLDELSIYGRALSDPEVAGIAAAGAAGKADFRAVPALSLAKVSARLDNIELDVANGDNSRWTTRSFLFTADRTNLVLTLQSLLPGTIVDGVRLSELPTEMDYLPEQPLNILNGEDAYGVWTLEIWDTRAGGGATNDLASLLEWELNFVLPPSNAPPVISLSHGIPYTNTLAAYSIQNFVVDVPQWATNATNVLLFVSDRTLTNPQLAGVLFDATNRAPVSLTNGLFWPPVSGGITNLGTNIASWPFVVPGEAYYLTVTNPNPFAITFAYGVWFDILSLTNCQPLTNYVWQAGVPRYYQFDVPTNALAPGEAVTQAFLYLTGVESNYTGLRSNVTVVVSQHLPLPDLTHYDYVSRDPATNEDIVLVLTNSTPFPIQDTRWYVGVFGNAATNIPFVVQACYTTTSNYPVIVRLTNGVPFTVAELTNRFIAPPGPPRSFFFELEVTNYVDGLLFELYGLSGDLDLVCEREIPPAMAPYFDGSFRVGRVPEQIVVRGGFEIPDLRGKWYLGLLNREATNVAYTIRAVESSGGLLQSGQPLQVLGPSPMAPPHQLLLQWNAVMGEYYLIEFTPTLAPATWTPFANGLVQATTPLSTFELPAPANGTGFYRVTQVSRFNIPPAPMTIRLWTNNLVRISWSTSYPNQRLQSADSLLGPWSFVNLPVVIEGNEYVVYDTIGTQPKYYRLIP